MAMISNCDLIVCHQFICKRLIMYSDCEKAKWRPITHATVFEYIGCFRMKYDVNHTLGGVDLVYDGWGR